MFSVNKNINKSSKRIRQSLTVLIFIILLCNIFFSLIFNRINANSVDLDTINKKSPIEVPLFVQSTSQYIFQSDFSSTDGWIQTDQTKIGVDTIDNRLEWNTDANFNKALKSISTITLSVGDIIQLNATYLSHSDGNTRQGVSFGFSNTTIIPDTYAGPGQDFLAIMFTNYYGQAYPSCHACINGIEYHLMPVEYLPAGNTYNFYIRIEILNTTHVHTETWRNGTLFDNSIRAVPLVGEEYTYYGAWNQRVGIHSLEGSYNGYGSYLAIYRQSIPQGSGGIPGFKLQYLLIGIFVLVFMVRRNLGHISSPVPNKRIRNKKIMSSGFSEI